MTPQELKNSILQMAFQGKLTQQRSSDGTGKDLLIAIQNERNMLIKNRIVKKDKRLGVTVVQEETAYDIPENWTWTYLGGILNKLTDGTHKTPKYTTSGVKFVSVKDMSKGVLSLENTKFISEEEHEELFFRCNPELGDMLLSKVGTTGVPAKVTTSEPFSLFVSVALLKYNRELIDEDFLYYLLQSPLVQNQAKENTRGVGNKNWVLDAIAKTQIVLPPVPEQRRIVVKIEELLPFVDRYEKAWSRLDAFNKRFPVDMQKSILQTAIQGKLVEQREDEGTAEELYQQILAEKQRLIKEKKIKKGKPLPEIAEDEVPFDIPESWKWVRLGNIISVESGKGLTSSKMIKGNVPVYGGNGITGYHNESLVHEETVVIGRVGYYCGSVHITESEAWITDNAFITSYPQKHIDRMYLVYILRHMNLGKSNNATAQPVVSGKKIYPLLFPLPPLAEQKRIVAKLEEVLPLCERLK